ncbi:unnamed protein product [Hymenolepis diminuta]|uniref:Uncharacterized protein n=1 Tax=Hymenolepis diminuta TaxID=6216 RepID=A0A564YUT9_HYMDI|nr:unnamed protein product [Hymenolepis diminuta]
MDRKVKRVHEAMLPKKFPPERRRFSQKNGYSVGNLVDALNHNLNHQWRAAIITKPQGGDIYDVETGKEN